MDTEKYSEEEGGGFCWKDTDGSWHSRLVPILALIVCLSALIMIPLKVLSYGYLPIDDALRHAGKAMTEKSWDEILVSDAPIPDVHIGWHVFLKGVRSVLGLNTEELVVFSVIFLFLVWIVPPLFLHQRPESWILTLLLYFNITIHGTRWLTGRSYLSHMAILILILLLRSKLCQKRIHWPTVISLTVAMCISIWWRTTWFLYAVPIAAFFVARQWRACLRLICMVLISTGIATLLTADPLFAIKPFMLSFDVMSSAPSASMLVTELQPAVPHAFQMIVIPIIIIALLEKIQGRNLMEKFDSPVFYLIVICWALGSLSMRWWIDFGMVAFLVFLSETIDTSLVGRSPNEGVSWFSLKRCSIVLVACAVLFIQYTGDVQGRWSKTLKKEYVDFADDSIAMAFPDSEGIIYSDHMGIFYDTFYKYPNADWRYIYGYEPAFMPESDLETLRDIQWSNGIGVAFKPWVDKMRPQDRLWVRQVKGAAAPGIPGLIWQKMTSSIWSGRIADTSEE